MKRRISLGWKLCIVITSQGVCTVFGLTLNKLDPFAIGILFSIACWGMAYLGVCAGKEARPQ